MSQHLLLLGAGQAHRHVLARLAQRPLPGVSVTLVSPLAKQLPRRLLPSLIAGHMQQADCEIALEPLLRRNGNGDHLRWLQRRAMALDAHSRTVWLDDGSALGYDLLSINIGLLQVRDPVEATLPGARQHGVFVRPSEAFAGLWPRVAELGARQAVRVAVLGGSTEATELAMAVGFALPNAAITLITGGARVATHWPPAAQLKVAQALKRRNITVLQDTATALTGTEVQLASGARLACDVPLIASGEQAPPWLSESGLALDPHGFIAVNASQQSTSHATVLATGELTRRSDGAGVASALSAPAQAKNLAANLTAMVAGRPLKPLPRLENALRLLSCGDQRAIASWGPLAAEGRWVGWLKAQADRRFVARYGV